MTNNRNDGRPASRRLSAARASRDAPRRRGWVRPFELGNLATPPKTFLEVVSRLEAQDPPHPYGHHVKSAFVRMGHVFRRPLALISTDAIALRGLIASAAPASVPKMTPQRWMRVRSLVTTHLRKCGIEIEPGRDVGGHSAAWSELLAGAPQPIQLGVSRFASYCTRHALTPQNVTEATFMAFETCLRERSLKERHDAIFRNTVRRWNDAVSTVDGWPDLVVPLERHGRYFSRPWADFPASYLADVEAFLRDSGESDIWDLVRKDACKPSTISLRRRQLSLLSSLLINSGFPIADLTSLAVLVTPENAIAALKVQQKRKKQEVSRSLEQLVWLLTLVARDWVKNKEHAEVLRAQAKMVHKRLGAHKGMTERNQTRLRQFESDANILALLDLPQKVFGEARKAGVGDAEEARRVMLALAVEMLLCAMLRGANLCGLEVDRHFIGIGRGREYERRIVIPAEEMKGTDKLEFSLPSESCDLMDEYLEVYRPRLAPAGSLFLFPNRFGQKREKAHFAKAVSDFILEETGLAMNVHLFRHFAVKLHLKSHPEDMETPRQFLMHRSSKVTRMHYTEARPEIAMSRYHQTIVGARLRYGKGSK
jgi:integrase